MRTKTPGITTRTTSQLGRIRIDEIFLNGKRIGSTTCVNGRWHADGVTVRGYSEQRTAIEIIIANL